MSLDLFWGHVDDVRAGMLDATNGARYVPMSHYPDRDRNCLWFITAKDTDAAKAAVDGPINATYILSDGSKGIYADLKGKLGLSDDRAKLVELWSPVADAWFDGGIDDPDLQLMSFHITAGEVWTTPTSGLAFMFKILRANVTGQAPELGSHFTI